MVNEVDVGGVTVKAFDARPLSKKAILVTLKVGTWQTSVPDWNATAKVLSDNQAVNDVGRFTKRLVPRQATARMQRLATEARKTHYRLTMPWDDKGQRLLPVSAYEKYKAAMDALCDQRTDAVNEFLRNYDSYKQQARKMLGELFKEGDYPSKEELRNQLSMTYVKEQVPSAEHFVADLAADEAARIEANINALVSARVRPAMMDLYQWVGEMAEWVAYNLGEDEGVPRKFKHQMVDAFRQVGDMLPSLNVFDDPDLERIGRDIKDVMDAVMSGNELRVLSHEFDPELHKKVKSVAESATTDVASAMEKLQGYKL